ncbi:MAG: YheC/YheD family protein [Clostridiales bacterium]|nr:YheC/YheD family protein [Clostridiales bacterium]
MKIGFLRYEKDPPVMARYLFALASRYGAEFFCFRPESVDVKNKKITGTFLEKGGYVERETEYPDVIDDVYSFNRKHKDLYEHLEKFCVFTFTNLGGKIKVDAILRENREAERYLIETFQYKDVDIGDVLQKYKKVIIKPVRGKPGRSVYRLHKEGGAYALQLRDEICRLSPAQFNEYYAKCFCDSYLVQRYVSSRTNAGNPFDLRIHVRRGEDGEWVLVKIYPRIGNVNQIVSNLAQGGSAGDIKEFLFEEFGSDWKKYYDELVTLSVTIPQLMQNKYDKMIDALGIDVGIDRENENELKIFEVNTFPGAKNFPFEVAEVMMQYYLFLGENIKK